MEQKKKSALTRQKILEAAEEIFSSVGFAAARVDAIAERAGVNKQMIYAHFESKEGVYSAVLERVYSRLSEYQDTVASYEFEGAETVKRIVSDYFAFLISNPSFVRLMLWENLNGARYVQQAPAALLDGLKALLQSGIEKGLVRADLDVEQTALSLNLFCFSAFSNQYTFSKLLGKDLGARKELAKRAEHVTQMFLGYILPEK
ncbi:MAG: TetR family transcriptional regulator [Clostridia bacterium]|nr:TetR family transcriptional regulator [Clostridia bacterium]